MMGLERVWKESGDPPEDTHGVILEGKRHGSVSTVPE